MRLRGVFLTAAAVGAITFPLHSASAGDKYQTNVVNVFNSTSPYQTGKTISGVFTKCTSMGAGAGANPCGSSNGSSILVKPDKSPGGGGIKLILNLKGVDCPNDFEAKPGQCGNDPFATNMGIEVNHVMVLSVNAVGIEEPDVAGVKYFLKKGKAYFQATGKPFAGGNVLGAGVAAIYDTPLVLEEFKFQTPGSNPADCDSAPLTGGNGCTDGTAYALSGIIGGVDPGPTPCTTDANCKITQTCQSGTCTAVSCTSDVDCNVGGGKGGSGQCGENGVCCDPKIDPTCTGQSA